MRVKLEGDQFPQWFWISETREVVVVEDRGRLRAFSSICPHMGARLSPPKSGACRLRCPWHGLVFEARDGGAFTDHPVFRKVPEIPVRRDGDVLIFGEATP